MQIKVIAPFHIAGQTNDYITVVPDGLTVKELTRHLRAPLYAHLLPVSVNGRQAPGSHILAEGDVVIFLFPLSGG